MRLRGSVSAGSAGPTAAATVTQTGSFTVPYFKVNSKGQIIAYQNRTVTVSNPSYSAYTNYSAYSDGRTYNNYYAYSNYGAYKDYSAYTNYSAYGAYNNYKNYSDYYNCCSDTDSDGWCFIKANLLTTQGFKDVRTIRPGDILVGPDGFHKVCGVSRGTVNSRSAVRLINNQTLVLTAEHPILEDEKKVVFDFAEFIRTNPILFDVNNGIKGSFKYGITDLDAVLPSKSLITTTDFGPQTPTVTPIVESGEWCFVEGGGIAAVAHAINIAPENRK